MTSVASFWTNGFTYYNSAINLTKNRSVECKIIYTKSNYLQVKIRAFTFLADSDPFERHMHEVHTI